MAPALHHISTVSTSSRWLFAHRSVFTMALGFGCFQAAVSIIHALLNTVDVHTGVAETLANRVVSYDLLSSGCIISFAMLAFIFAFKKIEQSGRQLISLPIICICTAFACAAQSILVYLLGISPATFRFLDSAAGTCAATSALCAVLFMLAWTQVIVRFSTNHIVLVFAIGSCVACCASLVGAYLSEAANVVLSGLLLVISLIALARARQEAALYTGSQANEHSEDLNLDTSNLETRGQTKQITGRFVFTQVGVILFSFVVLESVIGLLDGFFSDSTNSVPQPYLLWGSLIGVLGFTALCLIAPKALDVCRLAIPILPFMAGIIALLPFASGGSALGVQGIVFGSLLALLFTVLKMAVVVYVLCQIRKLRLNVYATIACMTGILEVGQVASSLAGRAWANSALLEVLGDEQAYAALCMGCLYVLAMLLFVCALKKGRRAADEGFRADFADSSAVEPKISGLNINKGVNGVSVGDNHYVQGALPLSLHEVMPACASTSIETLSRTDLEPGQAPVSGQTLASEPLSSQAPSSQNPSGQNQCPQNSPRQDPFRHRANELAREFRLTEREKEIAILLATGRSATFIATFLGCAAGTVRNHVKNIYLKLDIHSKQELITLFVDR